MRTCVRQSLDPGSPVEPKCDEKEKRMMVTTKLDRRGDADEKRRDDDERNDGKSGRRNQLRL